MNDLILYHMGYDGKTFRQAISILERKTKIHAYHHPRVIKWLMMEFHVLSLPPDYIRHARRQRTYTSPGIAGSILTDTNAERLYAKSMAVVLRHVVAPVDEWTRLCRIEKSLASKSFPEIPLYWSSRLSGSLSDRTGECEKLFKTCIDCATTSLRITLLPWAIAWTDRGYPISVATYSDDTVTLDKWILGHLRRCDLVVLIVHEIIGHHYQENISATSISMDAEACAMLSEKICRKNIWVDSDGNTSSLAYASNSWKLFRVLRAMVDLHLHSRDVRAYYKDSTASIWTRYPVMKNIVPVASEIDRCASLPGQALGYVAPIRNRIKGCIF